MKLNKAIEIIYDHRQYQDYNPDPDLVDALKLGEEALKRIRERRKGICLNVTAKLPGET